MRPSTVLYVNHVGARGGAEESLLTVLAHLDRSRWRPLLACPSGELAAAAVELGVAWTPLPCGRLHRRGTPGKVVRSVGRLARAAAALLPLEADLLHANSTPAALAAVPVSRLRSRPLLWHVRDLGVVAPVARRLGRLAARTLAISSAVAAELRRAGCPPERLALVPNALDPARCRATRCRAAVRAELGLGDRDLLVLCVGQLVPWKRQDLALRAVGRLTATLPELRLVVVGADRFGEHVAYVERLRALAAAQPAGRVTLLGHRSDVPDLLQAADALLLPSAGEPFGRVLLEAMLHGVPVVAMRSGGAPAVVGRAGLLVPDGDEAALAAALARLASDPALRARLAAAGRARVAAQFSPVAHAARLAAIYDEVLDRPTKVSTRG